MGSKLTGDEVSMRAAVSLGQDTLGGDTTDSYCCWGAAGEHAVGLQSRAKIMALEYAP